jgi:glycosyltransferase involved in cell wall biosynthesis
MSESSRRLLFVVNNAEFFQSHRFHLGIAAMAAGWQVGVAGARDATPRDDAAVRAIEQAGFRFFPIDFKRGVATPSHEIGTFRSLLRLYRAWRPDLVHQITIKPMLYGTTAARIAGVPGVVNAISGLGYVFTGSRSLASRTRAFLGATAYRLMLRHRNMRIIVQNQSDLDFVRTATHLPCDTFSLIPGAGVDTLRFAPSPEPAGEPIVVCPARLLWDKGIGEFVEAARLLKARGVRARFILVGDIDTANPRAITRAQVEAWTLDHAVEWQEHRADMPVVLASATIVCLPSYREGMPLALLEAAASGRMIVTSDVPGCRDIVTHNVTGLLVPHRDSRRLADAVEAGLASPADRRRYAAAARARAEREFTGTRVALDTLNVYDSLMSNAGRDRRTDWPAAITV